MNFKEKQLYHQIHPIKLLTDWVTGIMAFYFLWFHQLFIALIVMFIPSVVVSIVIIKYVNLRDIKHSAFGKYVRMSMTKTMEAVRFAGFAIALFGAWYHMAWLIIAGMIIIFIGWLRGLMASEH